MQFAVLTVLLATLLQTTLSQNATSGSVSIPSSSAGPSSVSGLSSTTIHQETHPAAPTNSPAASDVQNDEPKAELTTGVPEVSPTRVPVNKVPSTQPPLVHAETTMKANATKGTSVPQQKGGKSGSSRVSAGFLVGTFLFLALNRLTV